VADAVLAVVVAISLAFLVIAFLTPKNTGYMEEYDVDWRLVPAAVLILLALFVLAGIAVTCATRYDMIPTLAICTGVFLLGLMSDYLFGRRAEPIWTSGNLAEESRELRRTDGQRQLLTAALERYDADQDGFLNRAEADKISVEDHRALRRAGLGGAWWAEALYTLIPNWQLFWLADALEGKPGSTIELPDGTTKPNVIPWGYVGRAAGYTLGYLGATLALGLLLFEDRELS
jgi:hypothetical protein